MSYVLINNDPYKYFEYTDLKNLKNEIISEDKQSIHRLSGDVTFVGLDYKKIYQLFETGELNYSIDLYNDIDVLQGSGYLLMQNGSFNEDTNKITLKVTENNKYSLLKKDYQTEINIARLIDNKINVYVNIQRSKLDIQIGIFSENNGLGSYWYNIGGYDYYARQSYLATEQEIAILNGTGGWQLKDGTTNILIRDWVGVFKTPEASYFKSFYTYTDVDLYSQYPDTTAYLSSYTVLLIGSLYYVTYLDNNSYYGSSAISFSNFMFLKDVIKAIINEIDSTVLFDESGTDTDSFGFFNKYPQFENLTICDIASVLTVNGLAKTYPSTIMECSLERLTVLFREYFSAYWYLDDNNYFRLKQYTDIIKEESILPCHNLTDLLGYNFSENVKNYKFDYSKRYDKIIVKTTSGLLDFIGSDLIFPNIIVPNNKIINIDSFFFDINDIASFPDKYDGNSQNQFVIATVDKQDTYNLITQFINSTLHPCSQINGVPILPGEAIIADNYYLDVPFIEVAPSALGYLWSNAFAAIAGDELSISYSISMPPTGTTFKIMLVVSDYPDNDYSRYWIADLTKDEGGNGMTVTCPITSNKYRFFVYDIDDSESGHFSIYDLRIWNNNYYKIREATGALSGTINIPNVELSTANMQQAGFYSQMSDTTVIINNVSTLIPSEYLEKFKELTEITVPCRDFINQFNLNEYVKADISEICEIKSIAYNNMNDTVTLNLMF